MIPLLIFYSLAIYGLCTTKPVLLYLYFASMPFGSMAVVPPEMIGGLTLAPAPVVSILLLIKVFSDKENLRSLIRLLSLVKPAATLAVFTIVAGFVTYFGPRLFAGVDVIPLRGLLDTTEPLKPTAQNFSQLSFLLISVGCVFAFSITLRTEYFRQHTANALLVGAFVLIVTGLLDSLAQFVNVSFLLDPFRTATYALAVDVHVLGQKRVVGLMPEASSFGGLCLIFMTSIFFFRKCLPFYALKAAYIYGIILLLICMIWISTSSSAYVGLGVFFSIFVFQRLLVTTEGRELARNLGGMATATLLLLTIVVFEWQFTRDMYELFDRMVLQKTDSHSFEERSFWRNTAANAILGTYGFGVGIGGTRASSTFVAIFTQTGVLGGIIYYSFVFQLLLSRVSESQTRSRSMLSAFKWNLIPILALDSIVGSTADFGPFIAFLYGYAMATLFEEREEEIENNALHLSQIRRDKHRRFSR